MPIDTSMGYLGKAVDEGIACVIMSSVLSQDTCYLGRVMNEGILNFSSGSRLRFNIFMSSPPAPANSRIFAYKDLLTGKARTVKFH